MSSGSWVAGVDGCPGGWLVVLRPLDDPAKAQLHLFYRFTDVLALTPEASFIGVDMPIGLPEAVAATQPRPDAAARTVLGARQSSVFAIPSRAAVMEADYAKACDVALATSTPPRKISKQAYNLFPKIREIDALMSPALQSRVYEVHPEVGFWALNGEQPLDEPKKVKSRPHPAGLDLRRKLLADAGYDAKFLGDMSTYRPRDVGHDDLLDAAVCSWTAARIARGHGRRFPENPSLDAKGLRMEIWG